MAGKFEVSVDKSKKYRYTLKSGDGKAIVKSEAYNSLAECKSKINALKKIVVDAVIIDLEAEKKKALAKKEAEAKAKKAAAEKAKKAAVAKKAAAEKAKKAAAAKKTSVKKAAPKKSAVKKAPAMVSQPAASSCCAAPNTGSSSDSPWGTH
jgi:uncharacterized protein YegP (UPF0339 family)